ncbi:MAG TPA: flagellar biosynthesis protein FlhB, partial [Chromatiales bacterium]|nr:flagellar biosynthesis protein FlhB [Chromatiales bacterium]
PEALLARLADALAAGYLTAAPLLVVAVVAAVAATLAVGGWVFSGQAVAFRPEKLDPVKGLKRIFSVQGLVELVKAVAKFALVLAVAVATLAWEAPEILGLADEPLPAALAHAGRLFATTFLLLAAALVLIAAADVPFQIWNHARQLRMTRQEVKDELKDTEGRPEVRSRIRQIQRQLAQQRMMAEVPKADVVVTNPTHYAVALRYEEGRRAAPVVVAKGADLVALRIRALAREAGVPVLELPPLARALYRSTDLGREIPAALYVAVAQVLAYVYQVRAARAAGAPEPPPPAEVPVPEDLAGPAPGHGGEA